MISLAIIGLLPLLASAQGVTAECVEQQKKFNDTCIPIYTAVVNALKALPKESQQCLDTSNSCTQSQKDVAGKALCPNIATFVEWYVS